MLDQASMDRAEGPSSPSETGEIGAQTKTKNKKKASSICAALFV